MLLLNKMEERAQQALSTKGWEELHNYCEDAELAVSLPHATLGLGLRLRLCGCYFQEMRSHPHSILLCLSRQIAHSQVENADKLIALQIMCSMLMDNESVVLFRSSKQTYTARLNHFLHIVRNNARYVWKRTPKDLRASKDVAGAWDVAQARLQSDYQTMFSKLDSTPWSQLVQPFAAELRGQ